MLEKALSRQTIRYLNQVLGGDVVRVESVEQAEGLPYFLQDAYDVFLCELFGQKIVLACTKGDQSVSARQMDKHMQRLREQLQAPVIVALPKVAPGERRQLIRHDVPFVVPGTQLYAPWIGVILSERYPAEPRRAADHASPATQALLIWYLLHHPVSDVWHPFEEAAALGYAGMTATRAVRELLQFQLFELELQGRAKHLKRVGSRRELWEKAKPHLRSPVQRTLWTYDQRILGVPGARLASESALARTSMLNEPQQTVLAMTAEAVQIAKIEGIGFEPRAPGDAVAVQVWRYTPELLDRQKTVDPLSLWLSLRSDVDDRIQMALDEIEENFPW